MAGPQCQEIYMSLGLRNMVRGLLKSRWHEMVYVMAGQIIDDDSYKCVPKGHYSILFIWQGHAGWLSWVYKNRRWETEF